MKLEYIGVITISAILVSTNGLAQTYCEQLDQTRCQPEYSKSFSSAMCRAAIDGCEEVAKKVQSSTDRAAFRLFCAPIVQELKTRKDEPSKVLAKYAYSEGEAVFNAVDDIADGMIKDGGIFGLLYGGVLKMYSPIGSAIKSGKNPEMCETEFRNACIEANDLYLKQCK